MRDAIGDADLIDVNEEGIYRRARDGVRWGAGRPTCAVLWQRRGLKANANRQCDCKPNAWICL